MLYKQIDFAICVDKEQVFCVGGCANWQNTAIKPQNSCYDTKSDQWKLIPSINFPGLYEEHYQRFCLTMHRGSLIAFWLRESPYYVFGILDRVDTQIGANQFSQGWRAVTLPGLAPLRDTLTSNSIALQNEGKVVIFGGFRGQETYETRYLSEFMTVDLDKNNWTLRKKGIKRGDMFYYNQQSCSRIGR